jgi:hypothetical protein
VQWLYTGAVIIYRCSDYTIPYIAYVLNLVIQDILKALIKNNYNTSYTQDIYRV